MVINLFEMFFKKKLNKNHLIFQVIILILFLIISTILFFNNVGLAQSNLNSTGTVVIDGRELFKVKGSESFPAGFRADWINSQLKEIIESEGNLNVKVEQKNNSPIIYINNRYILTVTEQDTLTNLQPEEQANIWVKILSDSIQKAQQERRKSYIINRLFWTFIILILVGFITWFLDRIWPKIYLFSSRILDLDEQNTKSSEVGILKLVSKIVLLTVKFALWLVSLLYITNLFPLTRVWSYQITKSLIDGFTAPLLSIGNNSYSVLNFLILACFLIGLFFLGNTLANILRLRVLNLTQINRGVQEAIAVVLKYTFIFVGSIVLLQVWGFDLSSLTILASAISVAIGFGFQDIAKNFGSGLVLLFERPIKVGDFVEVNDYMGTIEHIGARSTVIRTLDQISIIVPNSRFLEEEVINWSYHNPVSRLHLPVGVSYNSDVNLVKVALLNAARKSTDVLKHPSSQVLFKGFGDSALNFELLVWIRDPSKQPIVKSELYFAIEASLKEHQIEVPFPQRDLHLRSGDLPIQLSTNIQDTLEILLKKLKNKY
jgi:small-conductance mechanosensitive channel